MLGGETVRFEMSGKCDEMFPSYREVVRKQFVVETKYQVLRVDLAFVRDVENLFHKEGVLPVDIRMDYRGVRDDKWSISPVEPDAMPRSAPEHEFEMNVFDDSDKTIRVPLESMAMGIHFEHWIWFRQDEYQEDIKKFISRCQEAQELPSKSEKDQRKIEHYLNSFSNYFDE